MALQNALRARLDGPSITPALRVIVCILIFACKKSKYAKIINARAHNGVAVNTCTCTDGVAYTGVDCPVNGAEKCESCRPGFSVLALKDRIICARTCKHFSEHIVYTSAVYSFRHCTANVCACNNGVAQTGECCPVNGAAKCKSCNAGWSLNHDKTKCTRSFKQIIFILENIEFDKFLSGLVQRIPARVTMAWRKLARVAL